MTDQMCGGCDRPTKGAMLCSDCREAVLQLLVEVPGMVDDLRISITKQARYTEALGAGAVPQDREPKAKAHEFRLRPTTLIFNPAASDAFATLVEVLKLWQGRVADHVGVPVRYPNPVASAIWLHTVVSLSKADKFVDAGHMLVSLRGLKVSIDKATDRLPPMWFAGRCSALVYRAGSEEPAECEQDLYVPVEPGETESPRSGREVECPKCGTRHDLDRRRTLLLKHADTTLATASEAARAIVVLSDYERGEAKLARRIVTWASRGQIEQHGTIRQDGKDRPLYRIGDVRALLADEEAREAARSAKTKEKA